MSERRVAYLSGSPLVSTLESASLPGPRTHILGTIHGFRANNCEVNYYIFGDLLDKWVPREKAGRTANSRSWSMPFLWDLGRVGFGWLNRYVAPRKLGIDYDLIYERYGLFQSLGRPFQRRGMTWILETNAPLAYEAKHDRGSVSFFKLALSHEVRSYQQCNILVCISEKLKHILVEDYRIDPIKIIVIPNGVDTEFFDPSLYVAKRHFEGFTVGFVGKLYPWQGLHLALRALKDLRKEGKDINLVVVGDGPVLDELYALANDLRLTKHVHFTGWVSPAKIPSIIAGFDVCFSGQTSPKKGTLYLSPLKLYEYMAMAKPVIASASSDAIALVRNWKTGFLFSPGDVAQLSSAMSRAYEASASESLESMGQEARLLVISEHSWAARIRDLLDKLPNVLANTIVKQA